MTDIPEALRRTLTERASDIRLPNLADGHGLRRIKLRRFGVTTGLVTVIAALVTLGGMTVASLTDDNSTTPLQPAESSPSTSALPGCPQQGWVRHVNAEQRLSICTRRSWRFATGTDVSGPIEPPIDFGIGTWPFPSGGRCAPTRALKHVPENDAFFFAFEYDRSGKQANRTFPPRPHKFRLGKLEGPFECLGVRTYLILFREHGRYLQVHIKLGRSANGRVRKDVLRSLDSLRLDE